MTEPQKQALKRLVRSFYDFQGLKNQAGGRGRKKANHAQVVLDEEDIVVLDSLSGGLSTLEAQTLKEIASRVSREPIGRWLMSQRGIGPTLAGVFLTEIDIRRCDTVSSLWKFAGLDVVAGHAPRMEKGVKRPWNAFLKTKVVGVAADCIMKACVRAKPQKGWKKVCWAVEIEPPVECERAEAAETPVTSERAEVGETPEFVERAGEVETPVGQERASGSETPEVVERAVLFETPVAHERAGSIETPAVDERAVAYETPANCERATDAETPRPAERAVIDETPAHGERAEVGETPGIAERAVTSETPDEYERAGSIETPAVDERAVSCEIPVTDERADVAETPASSERYVTGYAVLYANQRNRRNHQKVSPCMGCQGTGKATYEGRKVNCINCSAGRLTVVPWGKSDAHRDRDAKRVMMKWFLVDLWKTWRELEGLPARPAYSEEKLGMKHLVSAAELVEGVNAPMVQSEPRI